MTMKIRRILLLFLSFLLLLIFVGNLVLEASAAESNPSITLAVGDPDNSKASFDMGMPHSWIIRVRLPSQEDGTGSYTITDILDYRLTYETGSTEVSFPDSDGKNIRLKADAHYTVREGTASQGGFIVDSLCVSLTEEGLSEILAHTQGQIQPEFRIRFQAQINENALLGSGISNTARLEYMTGQGIAWEGASNSAQVSTGGIHLLVTDEQNQPLPGASFYIAREASPGELADPAVEKEVLSLPDRELAVVYPAFYESADFQKQKVYETTSDESGHAMLCGLAYGTYYLVPSQAPDGYDQLLQPIRLEIHEASHLTQAEGWQTQDGKIVDHTLMVQYTRFRLPDTGGPGTEPLTAAGFLLLGCGAWLLKKKKNFL